jgi:hypothetical protein
VCRDWRATVDSQLISQLCCDIDHLHRLRNFTHLRHVVVEGEQRTYLRARQRLQQRLWAQARSSSPTSSRRLPRLTDAFPAPHGDLSPLAALPGVQAVTLRCLPLLAHKFRQQAAHLTHLTSLTLHNLPYPSEKIRLKGIHRALSALTQLKALTLIHMPADVIEQALLAPRLTPPPAATTAAAQEGDPEPASALPCPWLAGLQSLAVRHSNLPPLRQALVSLTSCTSLDLSHSQGMYGLRRGLGQLTQLKVGATAGTRGFRGAHGL